MPPYNQKLSFKLADKHDCRNVETHAVSDHFLESVLNHEGPED